MPVMTRSARHSETTISMIDPNALLITNDPVDPLTERKYVPSRRLAVQELLEHKSISGVGTASPQLMSFTDSYDDEKSAVPFSDESDLETRYCSSRSSSTTSRFVEMLGTNVYNLSSLRTAPTSWRNTFPGERKAYTKIERGDPDDADGCSGSDSPSLSRRLRSEASPPQRSSSGNLQSHPPRHRRRHADTRKRTRSQNNKVFHTPLSDLLTRFSHAMTSSGGHRRDSGTAGTASFGHNDSRHRTRQHSSVDSSSSYIPFPSISADESTRTFPSPYSADAAAVFQAPLDDKSDHGASHSFDDHVMFRGIFFEDRMQVVFEDEETTDFSGSSASTSGSSTSSAYTASKSPGLLTRSRRRVSALARAVAPARCKFLSVFHKKRPSPRPIDFDDDPVEYDIPCLAYVTCLW